MYALLGLLLLPSRQARPRTLVARIVGLLALATLFYLALGAAADADLNRRRTGAAIRERCATPAALRRCSRRSRSA